jgi:hypothetical protein
MAYDEPRGRRDADFGELYSRLTDALSGEVDPVQAASLVAELAFSAALTLSGQCQRSHDNGDYAELRPVFDDQGLRYCCTGSPRHCTNVIAE